MESEESTLLFPSMIKLKIKFAQFINSLCLEFEADSDSDRGPALDGDSGLNLSPIQEALPERSETG